MRPFEGLSLHADWVQSAQRLRRLFQLHGLSSPQRNVQVDGTDLVMELQRTNAGANGYYAIGFSTDSQMVGFRKYRKKSKFYLN